MLGPSRGGGEGARTCARPPAFLRIPETAGAARPEEETMASTRIAAGKAAKA